MKHLAWLVVAALAATQPGCKDDAGARSPASSPTAEPSSAASASPPGVDGGPGDAGRPAHRYLALGDSFTIGTGSPPDSSFPARLVATWQQASCAVDLKNLGVNGYTTDDLIARELPEVAGYEPTFISLAIGANDIVRGSTADAYRTNVKAILAALAPARARGARLIVVPQPDWSRSPTASSFGDPPTLAASIESFNGILESEATATGATWINLTPLMKQQALDHMLAADDLHPSAAAYGAWADFIAKAIGSPCN